MRYKNESMPPRKRERHASDARIYENQALLLLEFQEHDLKFRTSNGNYKYFICCRCNLRVPIKHIESGVRCRISVFNQPCRTDVSAVPVTDVSAVPVPAPVQLCAVCLTSECIYACLPCMHKCACKTCASCLRECPICRSAVVNWKQIFEAGVQGTAEDIVVQEETGGPVRFPVQQETGVFRAQRNEVSISSESELSDSSYSVEYLPQQPSEVEPSHDRPQRRQMHDDEWVLGTTYCVQWSEAALVARCGNRSDAMLLLQSLEWVLRGTSSALNRALARLVSMGFNQLPARVCLLMHDGDEGAALDELLLGSAYVGVAGDHVESFGGF